MFSVSEDFIDAGKDLMSVYGREVYGERSIFKVSAGTTGTLDGDEKDTKTYVHICNPKGEGFRVSEHKDKDGIGCGVTMVATGDDDLRNLVKALKFAVKTLEEEGLQIDD